MIPTADEVLYALPEFSPRMATHFIRGLLRASPSGVVRAVWISAAVAYVEATNSIRGHFDFDPVDLATMAVDRAQSDAAEGRYSLAPMAPSPRGRSTMLPEAP